MAHRLTLLATATVIACGGAPTPAAAAPAPSDAESMSREYRAFLDVGRTSARVVDFVREHSPDFTEIDLHDDGREARPGDRFLLVDRDRTVMVVVIGRRPVAEAGVRLIGAHIDTPSPRLLTGDLSKKGQRAIELERYGGLRWHHWPHRPVAVVGRVALVGGEEVDVTLGLDDDFAFHVKRRGRKWFLVTSSTPVEERKGVTPETFVRTLHERHGITADDLAASELYVVPRQRAREVGLDRALIGAHGQDDRANSYAAWRAAVDLDGPPEVTSIAWLVDREEVGSTGPTGARSRFFELAIAWLLRAQGQPATEAALHRAMARTAVLSADTPACLNPNFDEVHEDQHAPVLGAGPALFPFTGRGGKQGGNEAHAEQIGRIVDLFADAELPLQYGELGRVDEGGGGTIAKYLAQRGAEVVDLGVCAVSLHSPMEITAKDDLWTTYLGFHAWMEMEEDDR